MKYKSGQRVRIKKAMFRRLVGRLGTVRGISTIHGYRGERYEVYLDEWGESSYFRASELEPTRQEGEGDASARSCA